MSIQDIQITLIVDARNAAATVNGVAKSFAGIGKVATGVNKGGASLAKMNWWQVRSWGALSQAVDRAEKRYDAIFRAGYRLQMMGDQMVRGGKALLGVVGKSLDLYEDYDFQLQKTGAALETNAKWQDLMSEAIQDTAAKIGLYKPREVAEAVYYWGSATGQVLDTQKELNDIMRVTETVMVAVAQSGGSVEQAMKGVYGILRQYNIGFERAAAVTKKLNLLTMKTALEFPDLIQSFKYVGPLAAKMGISFGQVAKLMGILGDLGLRGSISGRGFAMMLTKIIKPTKENTKALDDLMKKSLGVNKTWKEMVWPKGKFIGLENYINLLADSMKNLTEHERLEILTGTMTQNSARMLIPMIEEQLRIDEERNKEGKKRISILKMEKYQLEQSRDVYQDVFDKLTGSWKGLTGQLENSLFPILLKIGQRTAKMLTPFVKEITKALKRLDKFLDKNPEVTEFLVNLITLGGAFLIVAGSILSAVGTFLFLKAVIGVTLGSLLTILAPVVLLGAAFAILGLAISQNTKLIRRRLMNLMDELREWGKVLKLAGIDVETFRDRMRKFLSDKFHKVIGLISDAIHNLTVKLRQIRRSGAWTKIIELKKKIEPVVTTLLKFRGAILGIQLGLGGIVLLIGPVRGLIFALTGLSTVIGIIRGVTTALSLLNVLLMGSPVGWILLAIAAAIVAIGIAYDQNLFGFKDFVDGTLSKFAAWAASVDWAAVGEEIKKFLEPLGRLLQTLSGVWEDKLQPALSRLVDTFVRVKNKVSPAIDNLLAKLGELGTWLKENLHLPEDMDLISGAIMFLGTSLQFSVSMFGLFIDMMGTLGATLLDLTSGALSSLFDPEGGMAKMIGAVATIIDGIATMGSDPGAGVAQIATGIGEMMNGIFTVIVDSIGLLFQGLLDLMTGWFDDIIVAIDGFMADLGEPFNRGWNNLKTIVGNAVREIVSMVVGLVNDIISVWNSLDFSIPAFSFELFAGESIGLPWGGTFEIPRIAIDFGGVGDLIPDFGYLGTGTSSGGQSGGGGRVAKLATGAWNIPQDMLAVIHQGETVLPEDFATGWRKAVGGGEGMTSTASGKRVIELKVDVSSKDGSLSDKQMDQLQRALMGSDLAEAIEQMGNID